MKPKLCDFIKRIMGRPPCPKKDKKELDPDIDGKLAQARQVHQSSKNLFDRTLNDADVRMKELNKEIQDMLKRYEVDELAKDALDAMKDRRDVQK